MRPSPLKLEHYNLISLHLEPVPGAETPEPGSYADINQSSFGSQVQLSALTLENGEARSGVELKLDLNPKPDSKSFPYKIEITLMGIFDGRKLPDDMRDKLIAVNGASMLYGVARDMVLGLTSRALNGAVMLPTVQFNELAEQMQQEDDKALTGNQPASTSTHKQTHN